MTGPLLLLNRGKKALAVGVLLLLAGAIYYVFEHGADLASLAGFGYPGVAILMFLSSSTIVLPAPGFAAVLAAGAVWNPLLVGICAGVGAATGELSGYLLGAGGTAVLDLREGKNWKRVHAWLERHGFAAILVLALIPNPLFDILGMVAGSAAYPVRRFWATCAVGNSVKYSAMAYLASTAASWWWVAG
ncbi:MAG TPA: VTT domain-containing protein [Chloroflexota bacterium]